MCVGRKQQARRGGRHAVSHAVLWLRRPRASSWLQLGNITGTERCERKKLSRSQLQWNVVVNSVCNRISITPASIRPFCVNPPPPFRSLLSPSCERRLFYDLHIVANKRLILPVSNQGKSVVVSEPPSNNNNSFDDEELMVYGLVQR